MTAVKKKLLIALVCVAMLFAGIAIFSACNGDSDDLKVTFMVQDDATGQWQQYSEADVVDGSVTVPDAPDKDYYTFRNWFLNADGTGDPFTGTDITESISVYAIYVADQATIYIDGQSQGTQNIVDVVDGTYAPERDNLVFDGWYTDANYQVSFTAGTETENLYRRYLAEITFDNGHEVVYTTRVTPSVNMTEPSSSDIVQWYMDPNNIYYQDEEGNTLDFSAGVSFDENTTVTVLWQTPVQGYRYNSATDSYVAYGMSYDVDSMTWRNIPALSFLSQVKTDIDDDGTLETIEVTGITLSFLLTQFSGVETILVGEGIESIFGSFTGGGNVSKIVLPSTLNIVGNSFNGNMQLTEDLILPEGLEVIINSFHGDDKLTPADYSIVVPSTAIDLCAVPSNMVFTNNNRFENRDGVIYKVDDARGDILISAYPLVEDGVLYVPENVVGIQVGAFSELELDALFVYGDWEFVNYNEPQTDYSEYWTSTGSTGGYSAAANALYSDSSMNLSYGRAICGDATTVVVYQEQLPGSVEDTVFSGCGTVHYVGTITEGQQATVTVNAYNWMLDENGDEVTFSITSGEVLSIDMLISNVPALSALGETLLLGSVEQFGLEYDFESAVYTNLYLDVEYGYDVTGFTYELNDSDNTATVTGFDADTAYRFSNDANDYLVYIPETITVNGTVYTITAIADDAFNTDLSATNGNYDNVTHIMIPKTVISIGERAFYNTQNMERVYIAPGGLQVIGESAFEDCGITSIALPLADLVEVGPYAFKTVTLKDFESAEGEEDRVLFTVDGSRVSTLYEGIEEGMFFIYNNMLVQYSGQDTGEQPANNASGEMVTVKIYDVRVIAMAAGNQNNVDVQGMASTYINVGSSYRRSSFFGATDCVVRYELMTGSCYYFNDSTGIIFAIVSKIHTNAFTDMGDNVTSKIWYYAASTASVVDCWITADQVTAIASADYDFAAEDAIFEDGWWEGVTVDNPNYEEIMAFMAKVSAYTSMIY